MGSTGAGLLDSTPVGAKFAERFKQKFGQDVFSYAPFGATTPRGPAIKAMWQPIRQRPTTTAREAVQSINFQRHHGQIEFNANGSLKTGSSDAFIR